MPWPLGALTLALGRTIAQWPPGARLWLLIEGCMPATQWPLGALTLALAKTIAQ